MEQNLKLTTIEGEPLENSTRYRRVDRKLIYLTMTRLYRNAVISVFKYLKGSPGQDLFFPKQNNMK